MNIERNCQTCKYYKDEYCENLELKPCYPQKGCDDFSQDLVKVSQEISQELCEDCVSRERIKHIVSNITAEFDTETIHIDRLLDEIDNLPPVRPTRKTGHWIRGKYKDTCNKCRCTYPINIGFKNFCPNCGSKMESEEQAN